MKNDKLEAIRKRTPQHVKDRIDKMIELSEVGICEKCGNNTIIYKYAFKEYCDECFPIQPPIKKHGGKRKGSGRPKLKKSQKKEPTKVIRVPVSKLRAIFEILTDSGRRLGGFR